MKKLTLDQTWKLCVDGMWKWIAKQRRKDNSLDVSELKVEWRRKHFPNEFVKHACFFCEYNQQQGGNRCSECPARKIDSKLGEFWCEKGMGESKGLYWLDRPVLFYNKLVFLNRKRLAKRKKQ